MDSLSSVNRISGLVSGLDTDNLVKQLMSAERMPLDKLSQQKQLLEWKKEDYREITNLLRGFQDDFFNVLKPSGFMVSPSTYKRFTSTVVDSAGEETALVTATGTAEAAARSHKITVKALATAANATSSGIVTDPLNGTGAAETDYSDGNVSFNLTLDGVTKTITLSNRDYGTVSELINNATDGLNKLIEDAFGSGRINVAETVPGSGILAFSANGSKLTVNSASTNDALSKLKLSSGASNILSTSETLEKLQSKFGTDLSFNSDGKIKFKINGQEFSFNKSDTLSSVINEINSSTAGVDLRYSELTDKFIITSKQKGAVNKIELENTEGNFFDALKISTGIISNGTDAKFDLDDATDVYRSDNTFTIEGVTYNLNAGITVPATFTVDLKIDSDTIFNNIKSFVDKYNEVVKKLNDELSEPKYKDYKPLTDEQKEAMSEDQIEKWEEKAKSGLLKNDQMLQRIIDKVRAAMFDSIGGISGTLSEIGINTGGYWNKGQLFIDETKLKAAIKDTPDKVMDLFSKKSSVDYDPTLNQEQRSQRYKEEGIANRIYDIIRDNIRTSRDSGGKKGFLIEKAGIVGDPSESLNLIDKDIAAANTRIKSINVLLQKKEETYYKKFTALEQAISKMNQQSAWLTQQFGNA